MRSSRLELYCSSILSMESMMFVFLPLLISLNCSSKHTENLVKPSSGLFENNCKLGDEIRPRVSYPVKDLIKRRSALRHFAPALLHQLDTLHRSLIRSHGGAAHRRRLLHLPDDFWPADRRDCAITVKKNQNVVNVGDIFLRSTHTLGYAPSGSRPSMQYGDPLTTTS